MTVHFLNIIIAPATLYAVLQTLMHSLWIGAVMALLAGMVISLTKRSGPQVRYRLLTGMLTIFIIAVAVVFCNAIVHTNVAGIDSNTGITLTVVNNLQPQLPQPTIPETVTRFIQAHADSIVLLWLMVICFKCIQLISGLHLLKRLKTRHTRAADDHWNYTVQQLCRKMGIYRTVALLQSSLAKAPMVIGHFKPVILFPVGLLNALPASEVEAILLHELAHIHRNDFLINLLQKFTEIIFFFNPAVHWVSALIREEREHCCDTIAIDITQNKREFIHALVAFQEYNNRLSYAAGFPGSKNHLLHRVTRIITNNNKTLNNMEKIMLVTGIMVTCLTMVAFTPAQEIEKTTAKEKVAAKEQTTAAESAATVQNNNYTAVSYNKNTDTIPVETTHTDSASDMQFNGSIDGKAVQFREVNGKLKELVIDGKTIREAQYGEYKAMIEKMHLQMKEDEARLQADAKKLQLQKEEYEKEAKLMQQDAEKFKAQSRVMQEEAAKQKMLTDQQRVEMEKQAAQMNKNDTSIKAKYLKAQIEFQQQKEELRNQQIELQQKMEEFKIQQEQFKQRLKDSSKVTTNIKPAPAVYTKAEIILKPLVTVTSAAIAKPAVQVTTAKSINTTANVQVKPVMAAIQVKPAALTSGTASEDIIRELETANVIRDMRNLSFQITNDALTVNGVKQPADLHQKIFKKYAGKPGDTFSLSYSNSHEVTKETK